MAPLAKVVIFAGRLPFIVGVTALAVCGFKEFARASGLYRDWWMTGAVYSGIIAVGIASLISPGENASIWAIAFVLLIPILRNRTRGELQRMSLGILGFGYLGWMFGHLAFLANARNAYGYVCYVVFATEVNDVVAFTFGRMFGRHPLRSQISPRKTWEGALGALAVSMTLPWLLRIDSLIYVAPLFMHMTGYYYPLR